MSDAHPTAPGRLQRWWPWLLVGGLAVVLGLVSAPSGQEAPLDPAGTGPQGAKALVLLLRRYGATVSLDEGVPGPGITTAVVLSDQLGAARRAQVNAWVRGGGRLVVADPASDLQPGAPTRVVGNGLTTENLRPKGPCPALGLDRITRLSVGPSLLLRVAPGAQAITCFGNGKGASFLVSVRAQGGTVVGLGGAGLWTNTRLDADDNAALAVDLLAPAPGAHVDVLVASPVGSGTRSAVDLLNVRLKAAVLQLLVAFGVLAWWRGRRLGRPVPEAGPVAIAGSEIVVAVGNLLARTSSRDAAGRQMGEATCAWLGERLGLGRGARADLVAEALASRGIAGREAVVAMLCGPSLVDDAALVALGRSLARLRQEITRG